jgi:hypothetical protein
MKFAVLAYAGVLLAACATPQPSVWHDAPHPSDTCALLSVAKQGDSRTELSQAELARLHEIRTVQFDPPDYRCGDANYQTDANQLGLTFLAIGSSGDRHFAALKVQSVAGPLAAEGFTCLYEMADASWTLRGCQRDWIT